MSIPKIWTIDLNSGENCEWFLFVMCASLSVNLVCDVCVIIVCESFIIWADICRKVSQHLHIALPTTTIDQGFTHKSRLIHFNSSCIGRFKINNCEKSHTQTSPRTTGAEWLHIISNLVHQEWRMNQWNEEWTIVNQQSISQHQTHRLELPILHCWCMAHPCKKKTRQNIVTFQPTVNMRVINSITASSLWFLPGVEELATHGLSHWKTVEGQVNHWKTVEGQVNTKNPFTKHWHVSVWVKHLQTNAPNHQKYPRISPPIGTLVLEFTKGYFWMCLMNTFSAAQILHMSSELMWFW